MIATNVAEGLGLESGRLHEWAGALCAAAPAAARVAVDGRMMPHEWLRAGGILVKTDALDHHDDDFFPAARDIAWDVAGVIVEFDLDAAGAAAFNEAYAHASGDSSIEQRLPLYTVAYLAYRLGYVTLATESLGEGADRARFKSLQARYRRSLGALVAAPHRTRRC